MKFTVGDLVVDGSKDGNYYYIFKIVACESASVRIKGAYNIADNKLCDVDISDTLYREQEFCHVPLAYYLAYLKAKEEVLMKSTIISDIENYSTIKWNPSLWNYTIKGDSMNDVRYRTLTVIDDTGNTICKIVVATKPVDDTNKEFYIGWAVCSPKDRFNKKYGQTIAYGRMLKHPKVISYDRDRAILIDEIREAIVNTYNIDIVRSKILNNVLDESIPDEIIDKEIDDYRKHHFIGRLKNVKIGDIR